MQYTGRRKCRSFSPRRARDDKSKELVSRGFVTTSENETASVQVCRTSLIAKEEDLEGKPFVGPAGALLDKALVEAGIDRKQTYVTNAVKHFKWEPRGKRRIHKKPNSLEIAACRAWLDAEIEVIKPKVIVCLGATAAQSLLGRGFRVTKQRGRDVSFRDDIQIAATVHPPSILRAPDAESRHREMQLFVDDLRVIAKFVHTN